MRRSSRRLRVARGWRRGRCSRVRSLARSRVRLRGAVARGRGACLPLALELSHVGDDRPPVRRRDRPRYPAISPSPFVMTSKICPSGYFRSSGHGRSRWGRCLAGTGSPCRPPERRGTAGNRSRSAGGRAREAHRSQARGSSRRTARPLPFPVKKAASSFRPPIATVPGTGSRMDAPLKKKVLAVCGRTFGWSSMLGLRWMGGRLDVQPRAQPARATTEVSASAPSTRRVRAVMRRPSPSRLSGFGLRTLDR